MTLILTLKLFRKILSTYRCLNSIPHRLRRSIVINLFIRTIQCNLIFVPKIHMCLNILRRHLKGSRPFAIGFGKFRRVNNYKETTAVCKACILVRILLHLSDTFICQGRRYHFPGSCRRLVQHIIRTAFRLLCDRKYRSLIILNLDIHSYHARSS